MFFPGFPESILKASNVIANAWTPLVFPTNYITNLSLILNQCPSIFLLFVQPHNRDVWVKTGGGLRTAQRKLSRHTPFNVFCFWISIMWGAHCTSVPTQWGRKMSSNTDHTQQSDLSHLLITIYIANHFLVCLFFSVYLQLFTLTLLFANTGTIVPDESERKTDNAMRRCLSAQGGHGKRGQVHTPALSPYAEIASDAAWMQ